MMTFTFSDEAQTISVYNYSPDTLEYIGISDAYIAPNTGLPGNCTLIAPPEIQPGSTPVWTGDNWELAEDHRGQVFYDKQTGNQILITELGLLPDNATIISPSSVFDRWDGEAWQPSIVDAKQAKISAIKSQRDLITADYIIIDGNHFHSDANSRIQQLCLTKMGQAKQIPTGLMWQTKNNGLIELTNDIAAQFEAATMNHDMRLFANAQSHIAAVEALDDIQEVIDYDYSTGWQP
ncbi:MULTISPECIES: DUF4376 domain-containing protein [Enterobacter cloacae complex]|uniref:DUF4376 domain-containing protein n=1 Tax=Enterobacter cloacae complex TaxID=354276 RepID=UPI00187229B4|nr:DUF4376 domain-containing protein [Enterobacter hormaechei]MBE4882913.1 DUF4376 domain-containing protein [Enterobacter cloacae complex sp. P39RS]HBC0022689.1 DUF4376 domain-containing protein [Enterobacter hormaechei subsp. steigerwaltii]MCM7698344.1 DUF4376 domain-containing protein [Enterobacter hormaechei]WNZ53332.1 DUF4376 domain-containing protein [Enterobacter hormaechei subsp. xiangfangensis]HCR1043663.1 DUF4376 domain-containing protein [Enterobacter hormaechei]